MTKTAEWQAKVEISELQARYEWAIDEGRVDDLGPLFAPTANLSLEPGGIRCDGRDAVLAWFHEYCEGWGWYNRRHYITNVQSVIERESARCRAYFLLTFESRGKARIGWGHYDDTLEKVDGSWRFVAKRIRSIAPVALERGWAGASLEPVRDPWPVNDPSSSP